MPTAALDRQDRVCSRCSRSTGWEADIRMPWLTSLHHRPRDGLDIDKERLVLGSFDIGVADIGGKRVWPKALSSDTHEAPVQRYADNVHRLAIANERSDPHGHNRLGLDRPAVRPHPDPASRGDALFLGQNIADLDEQLRLERRRDPMILGPEGVGLVEA